MVVLIIAAQAVYAKAELNWGGDYDSFTYVVEENNGDFIANNYGYWNYNSRNAGLGQLSSDFYTPARDTLYEFQYQRPSLDGWMVMDAMAGGETNPDGVKLKAFTAINHGDLSFGHMEYGINVRQKALAAVQRRFTVDEPSVVDLFASLDNWVSGGFNDYYVSNENHAEYDLTCTIYLDQFKANGVVIARTWTVDLSEYKLNNVLEDIQLEASGTGEYYLLTASLLLKTRVKNYDYRFFQAAELNGPFSIGSVENPLELTVDVILKDPPKIDPIDDMTITDAQAYTGPTPGLSKGSGLVSWSLLQAPAGMTIDPVTGVVSWPNPFVSAEPFPIEMKANNSIGDDTVLWYLTVVHEEPIIENIPNQSVSNAAPYVYQPQMMEGTGTVTWSKIFGPEGLTVDPVTGKITWDKPPAGEHDIIIQAENQVGMDQEAFKLTVSNLAPEIQAIPDMIVNDDESFTYPLTLLAGTGTIFWTLPQAPDGMTVDENGVIHWYQPIASQAGYDVTVRGINEQGLDTESFHIQVNNLPPVFSDVPDQTISNAGPYTYQCELVGSMGFISWEILMGPAGLTIDQNGLITWNTPVSSDSPYTVLVGATRGEQTSVGNFQLSVENVAPLLNNTAPLTAFVGTPLLLPVPLAQGTGDITWTLLSGPEGVSLDETGTLSWPTPTIDGSPYTVTVKVENNMGADTKDLEIVVSDVVPAVAAIAAQTASIGEAFSYACSLDQGTGDIAWSLDFAPDGMSIDENGLITWPEPVIPAEPITVTVIALNSAGRGSSDFTLNVTGELPAFKAIDAMTVTDDAPVSITVELIKGTNVTWALIGAPEGMSIDQNGVVTWSEPVVKEGPYLVTVQASNDAGSFESGFSLEVVKGAELPVIQMAASSTAYRGREYNAQPALTAGDRPEDGIVSWRLEYGPEGMDIDPDTGRVSWTCNGEDFPEPVEVEISCTNDAGTTTTSWLLSVEEAQENNICLPIFLLLDDK